MFEDMKCRYAVEGSVLERYVQDSGFVIDDALMSYDNSKVKSWIYNYGSVKADIFWDEAFEKDNTYYGKDEIYYGGHAVTVIGWDDNFSKDKFITKAPADGAWIVKNSWGTDNKYKGIWYVTENYVKGQSLDIVLHKDALPKDLKKKLGIK